MAPFRRFCGLATLALFLAACQPDEPEAPSIEPPTEAPVEKEAERFTREPLTFADLPGWRDADLRPAFLALQAQCTSWEKREPEEALSSFADYGGLISDWLPACSVLPRYTDAMEYHRFFEDYFHAFELVTEDKTNKLTGYYEPVLNVSAQRTARYSAPIPLRPNDLIEVRLGEFDEALEGKTVWGRVQNGALKLYPAREDIQIDDTRVLAWADPADVFFLQIQGSGRLHFTDGSVKRAGFDAHNHRPFGSLANHLIRSGEIERSEASMQGIRQWMARVGEARAEEAMNVNPRFVFFRERTVASPNEGPIGAARIPLTPKGSVAVDLDLHPLGIPFLIQSNIPQVEGGTKAESHLLIAQDTGGAIKGVKRGDFFFGWGDQAGAQAGRMNDAGRFFVFLPQDLNEGSTDEPS